MGGGEKVAKKGGPLFLRRWVVSFGRFQFQYYFLALLNSAKSASYDN